MTSLRTRSGECSRAQASAAAPFGAGVDAVIGGEQAPEIFAEIGVIVHQQDEGTCGRLGLRSRREIGQHGRIFAGVGQPAQSLLHIGLGAERGGDGGGLRADAFRRQVGKTQRNADAEGGSLAELALRVDGPAVQLHQLLHQGQADTGALEAAAARTLHAMEALEEPRQLVRRNAGAGIADLQFDRAAVRREPENNLDLSIQSELEGVGEQVQDHLLPHIVIDVDALGERGAAHVESEAGLFHGGLEAGGELGRELGQVGRLIVGLDPSGFDAGEVEQGVDELEQPQAVALRGPGQLAVGGQELAFRLPQYFLEGAEHEGQGRAEFVRNIGEEGCFGAVELGEGLGALALLLVSLGVRQGGGDLAGDELQKTFVVVVEQPVEIQARDQDPGPAALAGGRDGYADGAGRRAVPGPARQDAPRRI